MNTLREKASQPRRHSFAESVANIVAGLVINLLVQYYMFPLFGFRVTLAQDFAIAGIFTVISIIRSYGLRRLFNWYHISKL